MHLGSGVEDLLQQLDVVHGPGADRDPRRAQPAHELVGEQEVFDLDAAHAVAPRPAGQHLWRVVGPDHQPGAKTGSRRYLAGAGVEADHLEALALRGTRVAPANGRRGAAREFGVRLGLHLDLDDQIEGRVAQELLQGERRLVGGLAVWAEEAALEQLLEGPLVRPARQRSPEREQWVVQQDQFPVSRQADIGLESLERPGERAAKRRLRVVRPVGASQPVGDQVACHGDRRVAEAGARGCEIPANGS